MSKPKVVLWDIETTHNVVAVFDLKHNDYINPENILKERYAVCASWKILGEPEVYSVATFDGDDTKVCKALHKVLSEADVLVHHNGDSFDQKFMEARMLIHGLSPLPPKTTIDTLTVSRRKFLFNSHKLDYLGQILGVGRKKETKTGLWLRVLAGDKQAIRDMVTYNKQDVLLLERVFKKLQPYCQSHINRELFGGTGCPRCGSNKIQSRGLHRAISRVYRRFVCTKCGGWFRATVNEKTVKTKTRVL